ncbi:hypothetical protein R6Z07F_001088 [Ovis aries]
MAFSLLWSLLLLGLLPGPGASRAPTVVTGTLGGSVTLPLQLQDGQQVESISWVCRSVPGAIATVTLVEAGGPDTFHQADSRYWGRLSVVGPDRSLQISHLSWADAGSYRAHVNLRSSRLTHTREYSLHVYEQLTQPHVTMSTRISGNGHCLIILTCVAESRGGTVTYSWTPLGPQTTLSHGGSILSVTLQPGDSALNFTCTVKNPVSNSSSLPILVLPSCSGPGILGSEESVGETVIGTLGKSATLPLEIPVGQEVEKVTWSSRGLVAILQPGPAGEPILVAGNQRPYSQRLSIPCHSYSLQISSLRLQDSGPYRAWITLHSPPVNITKDFILHVYCEGETAGAQNHSQLSDHEGWDLLHHPGLFAGPGWRGCSVQLGSPRPGGGCVTRGHHSQHLLEIWGQRQLSLYSQEPCQPELQLRLRQAPLLRFLPTLLPEERVPSLFDPGSFAD